MMHPSYRDNEHRNPPHPRDNGIKPFETYHGDNDDEEGHNIAHYSEDDVTGQTGVFRSDADKRRSQGRRGRGYCHPYNKFICLAAIVFTVLALGAGISVNNRSDSTSSLAEKTSAPTPQPTAGTAEQPSPIITTPVPPTTQPSPIITTPVPPTTEPNPITFVSILNTLYPPLDLSLPEHIVPLAAFGHVVALGASGDITATAMKSDPNDENSYGAFFTFALANGGSMQTYYDDDASFKNATTAEKGNYQQSMSLSAGGNRFAFSEGPRVIVKTVLLDPLPLGDPIDHLGPDDDVDGWIAKQIALSPGDFLGVLVSSPDSSNPQPVNSILELYHFREGVKGNEVFQVWDRVAQLSLSSYVRQGSIAFNWADTVVAVGMVSAGMESVATFGRTSLDDPSAWMPLGDPMAVAKSFAGQQLGGGVVAMAGEGVLAIGSNTGNKNTVVILKWDESESVWKGYGSNNVLQGESALANFGASIQFNREGTRLFVGAPGTGNVGDAAYGMIFIYDFDEMENEWRQLTDKPIRSDLPGDGMGSAIGVNEYGNRVVAGLPQRKNPALVEGEGVPVGAVQTFHSTQ